MKREIKPKRKPHERAHHPGLAPEKKKPAPKKSRKRRPQPRPSPLLSELLLPPTPQLVEKFAERMRNDPSFFLGALLMTVGALLLSPRPRRPSLDDFVPRDFPQLPPGEIDAEFVDDEDWPDELPSTAE